jgi:hypothetical protein
VIERRLENCAACDEYICDKLKERIVELAEIKVRIGAEIPGDDYLCFIQPYENKRRLEVFRRTGKISP